MNTFPDFDTLSVSVQALGITRVELNRPDALNAMTFGMVDDLHSAFSLLALDASSRVVILTAAGRVFCAGLDMNAAFSRLPGTEELGRVQATLAGQERFVSLVPLLRNFPKPIIAAINGPAVGVGLGIVLACDVRIGSPTASFSAAFLKVGLSACDFGISYLLPKLIGASNSALLLLTGRRIDSAESLRIGILNEVADDPIDSATTIANQILAHSPFGIAMTKQVMWTNVDASSLESAMALENRTQSLALMTADMSEAVTAFLEKRTANYANR